MAVVVRCTGCKGASQVGPEAVGLLVVCPRCQEPFLAIEEAAPVGAPKPRRERAEPIAPARQPRRRREPREAAEPVRPVDSHDPHDPPIAEAGGLPVSVLIGFALLPFAIPMLWLIGPTLLTQPPALSLAAPISLALSASVLCLAVVFTVDWTPSTRIKGVLMLVGLSYFVGLSLYFLKKDIVDRVQEFLAPSDKWHTFQPLKGGYKVNVPENNAVEQAGNVQPLAGWTLQCYRFNHTPAFGQPLTCMFGSGPDSKNGAADWLGEVDKAVRQAADEDAAFDPIQSVNTLNEAPVTGHEWVMVLSDKKRQRVVRVFRANGMVYYLSVEGKNLDLKSGAVKQFLHSLQITAPAGK